MKILFLLSFLMLGCSLFAGAQQDSSVFKDFSVSIKDHKVSLSWDVTHATEGEYFVVERATDGDRFETIGALRKEVGNDHYELTDIAPPNGKDDYRIRFTTGDGRPDYTKTQEVSLSGEVTFSFYPNPVDKLLIIRTAHAIEVQVIDAIGSIRLAKALPAGIQVLNISTLEKGLYILRVADKESNRVISSELVKN